jgi:hypothetical protein
MSTSSSQQRRAPIATSGRASGHSAAPRSDELAARVLAGTALHRLIVLVTGETSSQRDDGIIHVGNPLVVAEELKRRLVMLGGAVKRRVAGELCPDLLPPRNLPLALASLVVGIALLASGRYWTGVLAAYGLVALVINSSRRRRYHRRLFEAIDQSLKPDLQLLKSDRTRAEAIGERFRETGSLEFLEAPTVPHELTLPQGERLLLSASGVIKATPTRAGLRKKADGDLLVTSSRLLFLSGDETDETHLEKVVRIDVVDELRLMVTLSKREAPGVYFALGSAHTLARAANLARSLVPGSRSGR